MEKRKNPEKEETIQEITFFIVKYLEKQIGVCNVELQEYPPVTVEDLLSWEQRHSCLLPDDLKNFYLCFNGMKLSWSVRTDGSTVLPLGLIYLHPINKIQQIDRRFYIYQDKIVPFNSDSESDDESPASNKPTFHSSCRIFELDPCDGLGKVCLVFKDSHLGCSNMKTEIWFLDRSLCWHFLVQTFTSYYRLMLLYLGLPQWQYIFTDIGLSMQVKQWFNLYVASRLQKEESSNQRMRDPENKEIVDTSDLPILAFNQLNVQKVFKGKTEKKKPPLPQQVNQATKKKTTQSRQPALLNVSRFTTNSQAINSKNANK